MAQQKLQALGQLASGVAHDVNNILSIVEGYARMIESELAADTPVTRDHLQHIMTATKRGAHLTRQLLTYDRQHILPQAQCDLVQLLRDVKPVLQSLLTRRITLHMAVPGHVLLVPCDPDMVTQILINLGVNARDAIPDAGDISIALQLRDGHGILVMTDNGEGMMPDIIDRIFDPFFTTKTPGQGDDKRTGLGLSLVSGYMRQIGGDVSVESTSGVGTRVTLTFPLPHGHGVHVLDAANGGQALLPPHAVTPGHTQPDTSSPVMKAALDQIQDNQTSIRHVEP